MNEGSVAPGLAEGTAGVEHASEAEKAAAAKSEALVPWAKGEAKHEIGAPLCKEGRMTANTAAGAMRCDRTKECPRQCHKRTSETPKCERGKAAQTRANTSPVGHRESRRARCPVHLGGSSTSGSWREVAEGGRLKSKGPIEARDIAAGIVACNKRNLAVQNRVS